MSNRRPPSALAPFAAFFGQRVPGGCGECEAYQVVDALESGSAHLTVYHDNDCPRLARIRAFG